ncbi:MAG: hypothetical protein N5P05_004365 (plasmid) [Chroococcopsis gigantea SAG 12.99]|nr:hypothetical protein [Chroococcopsis gigantea SAG 12.99]
MENQEQIEFKQKHKNIFKKINQENSDKNIFAHYLDNLIFLGLVGPLSTSLRSGDLYSLYPTKLGYILLDLIGITSETKLRGRPLNPVDVSNELLR